MPWCNLFSQPDKRAEDERASAKDAKESNVQQRAVALGRSDCWANERSLNFLFGIVCRPAMDGINKSHSTKIEIITLATGPSKQTRNGRSLRAGPQGRRPKPADLHAAVSNSAFALKGRSPTL